MNKLDDCRTITQIISLYDDSIFALTLCVGGKAKNVLQSHLCTRTLIYQELMRETVKF